MHKKFHFTENTHSYFLQYNTSENSRNQIIQTWKKTGYSREKALNRADRFVGEEVRRSDVGTRFTYTQYVPTIGDNLSSKGDFNLAMVQGAKDVVEDFNNEGNDHYRPEGRDID